MIPGRGGGFVIFLGKCVDVWLELWLDNDMTRHGNTATEMKNSGEWAKVGSKHYRHISGVEVKYDCMTWGWKISDTPGYQYDALWVAKYEVERKAAESGVDHWAEIGAK